MVPEPSSSNTNERIQPDAFSAASKVAKAIMAAPTSNGRLVATVLSAYDLPDDEIPMSVSMSYQESTGRGTNEVSTGPPAAKHRDHANSFKFGGASSSSSSSSIANVVSLSAPLPVLFQSLVTFRLNYSDPDKNLSSSFVVQEMLRVNDTQWLILNLEPEDGRRAPRTKPRVYRSSPSRVSSTSSNEQPPTLRLKILLEGPRRPEISALVNLANSWFGAMDAISDATVGTSTSLATEIPKLPAVKLLLVPAVPLASFAVACLPIGAGVLVIGIPFFLPLLLLLLGIAAAVAAVGSALYFSTRDGRARIVPLMEPMYQTFLMTKTGQRIVYDVGPRPSPQALARALLPRDMMGKLFTSLAIDLVGSASYLLPLLGEAFDLSWAPVSMVLVGALYDDVMPNLKYVALMEELLPLTDWIPSATLGWMKEFGPGLIEEGRKKVGDAKVVVRRENEALQNMRR